MNQYEKIIVKNDVYQRIDKYLVDELKTISRSALQQMIKGNLVQVNGKNVKPNYVLTGGETIRITIPKEEPFFAKPHHIPLEILYEDEDIIVVNKPKGMVVHPAKGHEDDTLVNALLYHCKGQLAHIEDPIRPGIVHRIDKDTTGVLVACKTDYAYTHLHRQLLGHTITREYEAIVEGIVCPETGVVDAPIGRDPVMRKRRCIDYEYGRNAITLYKVLSYFQRNTYISCSLKTGRTHQIRVHMASLHHPVLGDTIYGAAPNKGTCGQTLHAKTLGFIHPKSGLYMEFEAPLPMYFQELLRTLPQ